MNSEIYRLEMEVHSLKEKVALLSRRLDALSYLHDNMVDSHREGSLISRVERLEEVTFGDGK